jgi:hypothetical protein
MSQSNNSSKLCSQEIAKHAYLLWEQEGRPDGKDVEYWLKAEAQLLASQKKELDLVKATSKLSAPAPQKSAKAKQPQYA